MKLAETAARIKVAKVELAKDPLKEVPYREAVEGIIGEGPIESCPAKLCQTLVSGGFLTCVYHAFQDHRPLILSPDHIWLLICQGFAHHVNANAETLRKQFVPFEGKVKLGVRRDDFVKGAMENDWEGAFPEFIEKMREYMGATSDLLMPNFSTTGIVERAACQIVMMKAMEPYFDYSLESLCGIPEFILEGTCEDWKRVRERTRGFSMYGLEWWMKPLDGVLAQFCHTAEGHGDKKWWRSFYKFEEESGGPYVTGHILKFFPYLENESEKKVNVRNKFPEGKNAFDGIGTNVFPNGLSKVSFVWDYIGEQISMEFISGFMGIRQDRQTKAIRPEIGWAVRDASKVIPRKRFDERLAEVISSKENDAYLPQLIPPKQNAGIVSKIAKFFRWPR
jgi:hypothetical protein